MKEEKKITIYDEIFNLEREFDSLKEEFYLANGKLIKNIEKIGFLEEKLSLISLAIRDEKTKKYYKKLSDRIEAFKKDVDFTKYEEKLKFIDELADLTNDLRGISGTVLRSRINNLLKRIDLSEEDVDIMVNKNLVYLNGSRNKIDFLKSVEELSKLERLDSSKKIIINLFDIVIDSYLTKDSPFDIYEKIMIINTLDTARDYL